MVFITHDEQHEVSDFFADNPHEHTNNYFEISIEMAIEVEYRFRYSDNGYLIYNGKTHQATDASRDIKVIEERYARLNYMGLPQLILKATENLEEAKEDIKIAYQARKALRDLKKKYLNF